MCFPRLLLISLFPTAVTAQVPIETESKEQKCKIQMNRSKLAMLCFIRQIDITNGHEAFLRAEPDKAAPYQIKRWHTNDSAQTHWEGVNLTSGN